MAESRERRRKFLEKLKPGCDELAQTLEGLSIEQRAVGDKAGTDLV